MIVELDGVRWSVVAQYRKCGKSSCRVCQEGSGHGPYFYGTAMVDGRKRSKYIGRTLPDGAQTAQDGPETVARLRAEVEALRRENESLRAEIEALKRRLEPEEPAKLSAAQEAQETTQSPWKKSRVEDLELMLRCLKWSDKLRVKVWKPGDFWISHEPREISVEWKRNKWHLWLDGRARKVLGIEKSLQWDRKPYAIRFRVQAEDGERIVSFMANHKKDLRTEAKRLKLL
ncbi:MAG: hypothetical protein IRY98_11720 [Alicyclobacillaceae bacterium]|nr:hypothetical protein [Alicyclobacillaceae bacterium]